MSKSERGFASMDKDKQREIAAAGGRAAHLRGSAHQFDSEEARAAGRKGGLAVSQNREHMRTIGKVGGTNSRLRRPTEESTAVVDENGVETAQ